jgi:hypothetical protein
MRASSKNTFFEKLEEPRDYRPVDAVLQPGWHGNSFVLADGSGLKGDAQPIQAFARDIRFRRRGSLAKWKAEVGPTVAKQMIPMSIFSFALIGPLIRHSGNDMGNPVLELVMARERGKTSLLKSVCAFWGDDDRPASLGLGVELSATLAAIEDERFVRSDGFLGLDETNHSRSGSQAEFLHNLIFSLEASSTRRRHGEESQHSRVATLISTNDPIGKLLTARNTGHDAAESRLVTIQADRLFDKPFNGNERRGVEALAISCRRHAGTVAHHFTQRLADIAKEDEDGIAQLVSTKVRAAEDKLMRIAKSSPRRLKTFALMIVAADLAREFGIFDPSWTSRSCVLKLYRKTFAPPPRVTAAIRVGRYLEQHGVRSISKMNSPLVSLTASGYAYDLNGERWICIDSEHFKRAFADWREMIDELKGVNALKTEGGEQPKSTIHAPRALSANARVFCFSKKRLIEAYH